MDKHKLRRILASEGLVKKAAKMGKWEETVIDTWPDGRQTHYLIALPGKYGGIYVGWIKPGTTRSGDQGVNWYVYEKSWKDWNPHQALPASPQAVPRLLRQGDLRKGQGQRGRRARSQGASGRRDAGVGALRDRSERCCRGRERSPARR